MPDPIERMNDFRDHQPGSDPVPSAAAVRRRGDQLRRRRHAALSGAAALAVVAVVVPLAVATGGGDPESVGPVAPTTDTTPLPVPASLSEEDLLTESETIHVGPGRWITERTLGSEPMWASCESEPLASSGAVSEFQRRFTLDGALADPGARLTQVIGEFPDATTARATYEDIMARYDSGQCHPQGTIVGGPDVPEAVEVDIPGTTEARLSMTSYLRAPSGGPGWVAIAGSALIDDRLTVVTTTTPFNPTLTQETTPPMEDMLRLAVDRLREEAQDAQTVAPAPTPSESSTGTRTVIPADFPLVSGWPSDDVTGPNTDPQHQRIIACPNGDHQFGEYLGDWEASTMSASLLRGSDRWQRSVVLYPTAREASTEAERFLAAFREDCARFPVPEGAYTADQTVTRLSSPPVPTSVDDVWVVAGEMEIGGYDDSVGRVVIVLRTGPALLLLHRDDKDSVPDQPDGGQLAETMLRDAVEPIAALCQWSEDGC